MSLLKANFIWPVVVVPMLSTLGFNFHLANQNCASLFFENHGDIVKSTSLAFDSTRKYYLDSDESLLGFKGHCVGRYDENQKFTSTFDFGASPKVFPK